MQNYLQSVKQKSLRSLGYFGIHRGMKNEMKKALEKAVVILGGVVCMARACDVNHQNVQSWRKRGWLPDVKCRLVELLTGGKVTRYQLRPDVFGKSSEDSLP